MKTHHLGVAIAASLLTLALAVLAASPSSPTGGGGFLVQSPCAWTTNESFRFAP